MSVEKLGPHKHRTLPSIPEMESSFNLLGINIGCLETREIITNGRAEFYIQEKVYISMMTQGIWKKQVYRTRHLSFI